jgi:hypothetical protein
LIRRRESNLVTNEVNVRIATLEGSSNPVVTNNRARTPSITSAIDHDLIHEHQPMRDNDMAMKTRTPVKFTKEESELDACLYCIRDILLSNIAEDESADHEAQFDALEICDEATDHLRTIWTKRRRRESRAFRRNAARKKPLTR